ncbi:MAG: carboxypeptidase-like regulatory domain-containing protein, partial [Verrucomicrobiales bacterium]
MKKTVMTRMMTGTVWVAVMTLACFALTTQANANTIRGKVASASGKVMAGVMVSAFDEERRQSTSVFSQADGTFKIDGLRETRFKVRARLMGQLDHWRDAVSPDAGSLSISMQPATGEKLEEQRPATSGFGMLKFDSLKDKLNFKMMCSYCHQIGTVGFRSPEKPVDWETMIRRMDGFGGLYRHTQKNIIGKI